MTGYTAQLEELNFDVSKWLKERLIRAMGVCVMLRDHNSELTEDTIRATLLKEKRDNYHETELKKATNHLKQLLETPELEMRNIYEAEKKEQKEYYERNRSEKAFQAKRFKDVLSKLKRMRELAPPKSEVIIGTLDFALEQVSETIKHDFDFVPSEPAILTQEFWAWRRAKIESAKHDISYHTEEMKKEEDRGGYRFNAYQEFTAFVDSVK